MWLFTTDKCDVNTQDFSRNIAKPLLAELIEMGCQADNVVQLLRKHDYLDVTLYLGM